MKYFNDNTVPLIITNLFQIHIHCYHKATLIISDEQTRTQSFIKHFGLKWIVHLQVLSFKKKTI